MCCLSVLVTVISVPINGVVLLTIIKNKKFHTIFYFIMLNTILSDILIAAILCPLSIWIHTKEIQEKPVDELTQIIFHCGLFTLCMVSVLSITVLSIDRMISLKFPSRYRVMQKKRFVIGLVTVWLLAIGLTPIYFLLEFKVYLPIISVLMVLITAVVMVITYMFYRTQLKKTYIRTQSYREEENSDGSSLSNGGSIMSLSMSLKRKFTRKKKDSTTSIASIQQTNLDQEYQTYQMEKRATNTFFYMMVAFLFCYIPMIGISVAIAMHAGQPNRECFLLEILHECTILLGMLSSVCKITVFLARLTALRKACANLFVTDEEMERRWRKESVPVTTKKLSLKEQFLRRKPDDIQEEVDT